MADELPIEVRLIEPGDKLTGLSLGHSDYLPLKIFLQRHAKTFQEKSLARTYGAFKSENKKIIAYITLVCGEVVTAEGDDNLIGDDVYNYKHYPAVKIARLAVETELRGSGIGQELVSLALGIAKDVICPAVGCRFVVVDSKKGAVSFYEKCGFTMLDTKANRERSEPVMFVDLHKA